MKNKPSKFFVYSICGLPVEIWGESYVVITAFESTPYELTTEFFIKTKLPKEALKSGSIKILLSALPPEIGKIDIEFALQEGLRQTELSLMDLLETRATELCRHDMAYLHFELKKINNNKLQYCWMRGQFNSQLKEVQANTNCDQLERHIQILSQTMVHNNYLMSNL